jgi:hypothetical protein
MKTDVCIFEGKEVHFEMDKEHGLMINATEMAKIFNADVNEFTRNKGTIAFIGAALKTENSRFLENEKTSNSTLLEEDLIVSKQRSGTWMHRILALKFAAWLSPEFELWVYSTIEDILFGKLAKREKSFERTFALQQEVEHLIDKPNKTGEDFIRYLELQKQLKYETAYRRSLTVEESNEMKRLF